MCFTAFLCSELRGPNPAPHHWHYIPGQSRVFRNMLANKSNILPFYIPLTSRHFTNTPPCGTITSASTVCRVHGHVSPWPKKKLQDTCKAKANIRHDGRNWHGPLGTWKYSAPCSWERRGCGDSYQGILKGQCTTGSTFPIGLWQVATSALGSCFVDGREKDPHPPPPKTPWYFWNVGGVGNRHGVKEV